MIRTGIFTMCDRAGCGYWHFYPLSPRVAPSMGDYIEARKAAIDDGWSVSKPRIGERVATCPECLLGDAAEEVRGSVCTY